MAERDEWILRRACYSDGSVKRTAGDSTPLRIVHAKCFRLRNAQSVIDSPQPSLKPDLELTQSNLMEQIDDVHAPRDDDLSSMSSLSSISSLASSVSASSS